MKQRESSTTCFACRSVGHSARDCPNVLLATEGPQGTAEMLGDTSAKANAGSQAAEEGTEESGEKPKKGMKRKKGKLGADLVGGKCYRSVLPRTDPRRSTEAGGQMRFHHSFPPSLPRTYRPRRPYTIRNMLHLPWAGSPRFTVPQQRREGDLRQRRVL